MHLNIQIFTLYVGCIIVLAFPKMYLVDLKDKDEGQDNNNKSMEYGWDYEGE